MKIYLCKKCNKTIPLNELAEHRKLCGPDSDITLKQGWRSKVGAIFKIVFMIVAAVVLVGVGVWLGSSSFKSIASMRRLERIPATVVHAALPGEVNLNGKAGSLKKTLKAPKSGAACFYYRYLVEREERDSDGDKRWVTVSDDSKHTAFTLSDETGRITVCPDAGVDFSMKKSFRTTSGSYRYSEWRIDPNDRIFVFGYVVDTGKTVEIRFNRQGHYDPIISKYGEARERLGMAGASIGACWGGLVALVFAAALVIGLLKMHRLLAYFSILGVIMMADLSILGFKMMKAELTAAVERVSAHEQAARKVIQDDLNRTGARWDGQWESLGALRQYAAQGLTGRQTARLARIKMDVALAIERVRKQRRAFPERVLAPMWQVPVVDSLPLSAAEQAQLAERSAKFVKAKIPMGIGWAVIGSSLLLSIVTFGFGFRKVRFKRCIENLPTSPTAGASYGLSEFKGIVTLPEMEEPLQGPVSLCPCVQYHYVVKERRRSGKKTSWVTILDEKQSRPFLCKDADGTILVDPDGAQVMSMHRSSRREGKYLYTENRLELNDPLYAIGECVIEPSQGDALYLKKPDGRYPFILSNYTENVVMLKVAAMGIFLLNVSFAGILLTTLVLFGLTGSFAATDYLASALAAPLFMTVVTLALHFNDLVFLRERANRNWSNIDVSLQKRHDLVPSLEKMVKAYMAHESEVQQAITEMRNAYNAGESRNAETVGRFMQSEHTALSQVLAVYEAYPELKADKQAAFLMRSLIMLENEVGFMRSGYNNAVETYNTRIQTLPDLIFAKLFVFGSKDFIHAESETIRMPPSIRNLWEKDRAVIARKQPEADAGPEESVSGPTAASAALASTAAGAPAAAERVSEDMTGDAIDGRAVIYALLLSDDENTRNAQLETVACQDSEAVSKKTASLTEVVAEQIKDDVGRLKEVEDWFEKLEALSPDGYRAFKAVVRKLMEQDDVISLFEYALQKSMTRRLDQAFGMRVARPIRHQNLALIAKQASLVLSRLAYAEEKPSDTAQAAFDQGVSLLNHEPKTDLTLMPLAQCPLAAFDNALEEIAHATNMVKTNFLYACGKAVEMNGDYTYDQALLLIAMADTFEKDRPDWVMPTG